MEIIFWCEFPELADWKKINSLFSESGFSAEIYIACSSRKELDQLKRKINQECPCISRVNPWPLLPKEKGYWFSGFTEKDDIDKLHEFSNLDVKVDLEPPYPKTGYSFFGLGLYGLRLLFKSTKNSGYLEKTMIELAGKGKVISNEFPFPAFVMKRLGCYIDVRKHSNMTKNFIFYSTFVKRGRFLLRAYYRWFAKKAVKKYNDRVMFSLGLLRPGVFRTEPVYINSDELIKDIEIVKRAGAKKIAIYAIEGLLERKQPAGWLSILSRNRKA
jgi:hypothetical protein